ncbi:hypothetical protein [Caldimicrobium thiodismutans]|uniref:hypothetical protein n=1 Tax=Caldimicrobium thiodismutans TaxID=1653476 RepID=UPI0012947F8F|nr:hypothetical protein [Caldimicrobium thiodismutans]
MELKSFWDRVGEKFYKQGKYQWLIEDARELVLEAIEVKLMCYKFRKILLF